MFKTVKQRAQEARDVRRAVECAVETGNIDQALTLLIEYQEINFFEARSIAESVGL